MLLTKIKYFSTRILMNPNRHLATSLMKGLDVLNVIARHPTGVSIQDATRLLTIPRTSILRILVTLQCYGLVEKAGKTYRTTEQFADWTSHEMHSTLKRRFRSVLKAVSQEMKETAILGILEGSKIRHIDFVEWDHAVRIDPAPTRRHPLETTAMGKLVLSQRPDLSETIKNAKTLKEIEHARKTGIAWNRQEYEAGVFAVATWAASPSGITPMISVSWPIFRYSEAKALEAVKIIRKNLSKDPHPGSNWTFTTGKSTTHGLETSET